MILTDEKQLRVECANVLDSEIEDLVNKLQVELALSAKSGRPGIGLAAPQIGIAKNIAIVRINEELSFNLVNATIDHSYDKRFFDNEGCLSFPGQFVKTLRYDEIHITNHYQHKKESFILTGLPSVVAQHEIDHLHSILLPDVAIKQDNKVKKQKMRPNDQCSCNSGKKYKKCCGKG